MHTDLTEFCIDSDMSFRDAIARMNRVRLGIVLVVDSGKRLLGVITDGDIRRALLAKADLEQSVNSVIESKDGDRNTGPVTVTIGADPEACFSLLRQANSLHLPVVDNDQRVVGLITMDEFLPTETLPIKAVIMAGGQGVRLRPLTDDTPKPMLPVGERPLLEIMIRNLRSAGIRQVSITTHHKPEKISEHFGDGRKLGVDITYVKEDRPLGTAGGIKLLEPSTETLLVLNGDILTQVNFQAMLSYHREHCSDLTVGVKAYEVEVPYGVIESEGHHVRGVSEKPMLSVLVNAGIYLLEPSANAFIPVNKPSGMTELIQNLLNAGRPVINFPIHENWLDIGNLDDYHDAQTGAADWTPGS